MNSRRCLVVLSSARLEEASHVGSTSAYSFIQAYGLLSRAHVEGECFAVLLVLSAHTHAQENKQTNKQTKTKKVVVATPDGKEPSFDCETEEEEAWISEHRELTSSPSNLARVKSESWDAVCIPSSIGATVDLGTSEDLGALVAACFEAGKPVCVIGYGLLGLAKAVSGPQSKWVFQDYNVSGCSNMELARLPYFSKLPMLPEETAYELGGLFTASQPDAAFIIVDRKLISGQNAVSTTLAVLNLVWLSQQ